MKSLTKLAILTGAAGAVAYTAKRIMSDNSKEKIREKTHEISQMLSDGTAGEVVSDLGNKAAAIGKEIGDSAKDFVEKNINPDGPLATSFNELKETLASKLSELEYAENLPLNWVKFLETYENAMNNGVTEDIARVGNFKFTHDENLSQFTLWAFMGAPLNFDVNVDGENTDEEIEDLLSITSNEDIVSIKEDILNNPCKRIKSDEFEDIILKPLAEDEFAVCFFNKSNDVRIMELNLQEAVKNDFITTESCECYEVYDLLTKESFDIKDDLLKYVPIHGTRSFKVKAKK